MSRASGSPSVAPGTLAPVTPELDRLLSRDAYQGLEARPLHELRALRRSAQEWENALSLARRLAHGRLDILGYELRRRQGDEGDTGSCLLFDLPDVLAEESSRTGGRAVLVDPPGPAADTLAQVLDRIVAPTALCRPDQLSEQELPELFEHLGQFERRLSEARRALHERMDVLQAEIGRRYRDGEASIDSLLG